VVSQRFSEKNELIRFAKDFVTARVDALEKDVAHCLREPYAPFPAIMYCFSTVDLLGALYAGDGSKKAPTSKQSEVYMKFFMYYTEDQAKLLMTIFRHKIVHLAQPKAVSEHNGKKVAWRYSHDDRERHLKLTKLKEPVPHRLTSCWTVTAEYEFEISITHLAQDVAASVREPGGYLHKLRTNTYLQGRFEKAISDIYETGS
jgi:hypothetical protein